MSCDNGPPWCDQYRRLTAEVDTATKYAEAYFDESELLKRENAKLLAANGDLANLIGKREAEVARLKAALEASKEYTELLGKAEADALGLLHIHGYKVSADMVRRGAELRLRIAALSEEMK